ncbi:hypothetical protein FOCC_FOCC004593 [Frankliniella occidentalis]|uniref:Brachyurin n=1 Tax=Frankliniella occidentalis TaxID=133901 RepID=A0A9C6U539_FRAOC|nr:brachyurin [Frankliniella occidentalis]KAE8748790.1 hypothetical protein FOCC_FOCC004593 [Frankliniella occidentalis]
MPNMRLLLLLSLTLSCSLARSVDSGVARSGVGIVGPGSVAGDQQFPWQALVRMDSNFACGGSILSASWILTAAQCVRGFSRFSVMVGSTYASYQYSEQNKWQEIGSRQAIYHEDFNNSSYLSNDIGLIQLSSPITWTAYTSPIPLPSLDASNTFSGWPTTLSGFGSYGTNGWALSNRLRYVNLVIMDNDQCAATLGDDSIRPTNMCTPGSLDTPVGACNGDAGSPLVVLQGYGLVYQQVGIVSYSSMNDCGSKPTVFTRVTPYLDWISNHTGIVFPA